jgi:hypothetical protein
MPRRAGGSTAFEYAAAEEAFEQPLFQEGRLDVLPIPCQRIGVEVNTRGISGDARCGKHGYDHCHRGPVRSHHAKVGSVVIA